MHAAFCLLYMFCMFRILLVHECIRKIVTIPHVLWVDNFSKVFRKSIPRAADGTYHSCMWTRAALRLWMQTPMSKLPYWLLPMGAPFRECLMNYVHLSVLYEWRKDSSMYIWIFETNMMVLSCYSMTFGTYHRKLIPNGTLKWNVLYRSWQKVHYLCKWCKRWSSHTQKNLFCDDHITKRSVLPSFFFGIIRIC